MTRILFLALLLAPAQLPAAQAAAPRPPHWIAVCGCSAAEPFPHVGDSLHPGDACPAAMADAIDLRLFAGAP